LYRTWAPLATIVTVLALAACGGSGSSTIAPPRIVTADPSHPPVTTKVHRSQADGAQADEAPCQARLGDFLARMDDLRHGLLAGLSYDEYVLRVRAVRDAYETVPVDKLGAACVTGPAAAAEDAFNQYLRAANAWGKCAATAGCAASEVEAKLQRRWKLAAKHLDAAERSQ